MSKKIALKKVTLTKSVYLNYKYRVTYPTQKGQRGTRRFKLKKDALAFVDNKKNELLEQGDDDPISKEERAAITLFREFVASIPKTARKGLTLHRAVELLKERHKGQGDDLPSCQ